ncbi:MAG: hypothetical protein Q8L00_13170 [Deltaproteobacteria bacterium]|nr:hypothetical protein [Deltaproteobacteria bacterium]
MIYLILAVFLMGLLILAAPISLGYDSGEPCLRIKWLGLSLKTRLRGEKPKKLKRNRAQKSTRSGWAVLRQLWDRRDLCLELFHRVRRLLLEVIRTLSFRDSAAGVSLPDPMLNGLLYAAVSTIHLENVDFSVNFENRNFAKIRVTVYPYRVASKLTIFLIHLPYIQMLRFAWDLKKTRRDR